ncbi:MAG: nuclear transport factor 2 family protein [Myxococcota bacterium]|nr:nuclear transport factor 2 family protein [Myxococcales bacterium]
MPDAPAKKPRVRLDDDEAWRFLEAGHTGILTSLRRDGAPIALPVWYVVEERTIYVGGPSVTRKFARMRRDPRVSFLVERGRAWRELAAVQVNGRAAFVDDAGERARLQRAIDRKYEAFRSSPAAMPDAVAERYAMERLVVGIRAEGRILSWDNARLGLPRGANEESAMTEADRRACHDLALRYARAADRRDYDAFADIFTPDGEIAAHLGDPATTEPMYRMRGIDTIRKAMVGLERYAHTLHVVANHVVDDDGTGETYCTAHHVYRDDDGTWMNYTMFIRYQDRYARTADGWRFASRTLAIDFHRRAPLGETLPG